MKLFYGTARWRIGAAMLGLVLAAPLAARAADAGLAADWQGQYFYAPETNRSPVAFQLHIASMDGGKFTGRTTEPATFGTQPCTNLYANVSGQVAGDKIEFTKTYDGTCGQTHSVFYSGTLQPGGRAMDGRWSVSATFGGTFTATAR